MRSTRGKWPATTPRLGGQNYKTGKLCHIYRPWAEDAKGQRVWCDLTIDADVMTITVPQDFLDSAAYPVLVDPTFGYTTHGASNDNPYGGHCILCQGDSTPSNGTLTSITIMRKCGTSRHGAQQFTRRHLQRHSRRAHYTLRGGQDTGARRSPDRMPRVTTSIVRSAWCQGTQYWLGTKGGGTIPTRTTSSVKFDTNGESLTELYYNPASSTGRRRRDEGTTANERWSIYATYTASAATAVRCRRQSRRRRPRPACRRRPR
jgi:hypothetical protein